MMHLYLVRHGEAERIEHDFKRPLTAAGKKDVYKVGVFLKDKKVSPWVIWHSPKTRAHETAQILSEELNIEERLEMYEKVVPDAPVQPVIERIEIWHYENPGASLMIVSHLPFLPGLCEVLLGPDKCNRINFETGGVNCLRKDESGAWQFEWAVSPYTL
ncbi:MAG: phosphohistidine phosphatase SixA [Candidatus Omnitrophica bacterium]|nr:phosphohistidine phosphatase SixA [Candidatus Omnitrophota bacterium]